MTTVTEARARDRKALIALSLPAAVHSPPPSHTRINSRPQASIA